MSELYDADYFLRGRQTGKSLYEDYRWLPDLTVPMVCAMISHLGIEWDHSILDFGCARGYTVKALRELGYSAFGVDISKWALENADENTKKFLNEIAFVDRCGGLGPMGFDWVLAKDVLEHIPDTYRTIENLLNTARVGVFAVVPLGSAGRYFVPEYEEDITHLHRWTLAEWVTLFIRPGWSVEACYRVPGIKDNYAQYKTGNGFIVARRL